MNKYFPVSRASTQKQSRGRAAQYKYARVSKALARVAGSPPVPGLSTGILRSSSLFAIAHRSSDPIGRQATGIASRYARPSGLLT